jgi:glucose-6-phosphate isomerase
MLPTITTPVELHSVGQLLFAKTAPVYTDFITFDGAEPDIAIPGTGIAAAYKKRSLQEVGIALYGGVIAAFQDAQLPYRSTIMTEDVPYSLGLFVGMRMREVMYLSSLMDINAFDQPNVELYKKKTRDILGL